MNIKNIYSDLPFFYEVERLSDIQTDIILPVFVKVYEEIYNRISPTKFRWRSPNKLEKIKALQLKGIFYTSNIIVDKIKEQYSNILYTYILLNSQNKGQLIEILDNLVSLFGFPVMFELYQLWVKRGTTDIFHLPIIKIYSILSSDDEDNYYLENPLEYEEKIKVVTNSEIKFIIERDNESWIWTRNHILYLSVPWKLMGVTADGQIYSYIGDPETYNYYLSRNGIIMNYLTLNKSWDASFSIAYILNPPGNSMRDIDMFEKIEMFGCITSDNNLNMFEHDWEITDNTGGNINIININTDENW